MNNLFKVTIFSFFLLLLFSLFGNTVQAEDDYLIYGEWSAFSLGLPAGHTISSMAGFIDERGLIGGIPGAEYIFFASIPFDSLSIDVGDTVAYVVRVEIDCNNYCSVEPDSANCIKRCPQMHPDHSNPEYRPQVQSGPAPRKFTVVNTYYLGWFSYVHAFEFHVDNTGIYLGTSKNPGYLQNFWFPDGTRVPDSSFSVLGPNNGNVFQVGPWGGGGIFRWGLNWVPKGWVISIPCCDGNTSENFTETLARNPKTGEWWAGGRGEAGTQYPRNIYKWYRSGWNIWVKQFNYPSQAGGTHHDGMEIVGKYLYVTDMTVDYIFQYELNEAGNVVDPNSYRRFNYTQVPVQWVEGMGFGPNNHFWVTGGGINATFYELGGNEIQEYINEVELDGILDQTIISGYDSAPLIAGLNFVVFDLKNYVTGSPPFTWGYENKSINKELDVDIDSDGIVVITYLDGWIGQEEIEFEACSGSACDTDSAIFKVNPAPNDPPVASSLSHDLKYCTPGEKSLANLSWNYSDAEGDIPGKYQLQIFDLSGNKVIDIEKNILGSFPNPLPAQINRSWGVLISNNPGPNTIRYNDTYTWQVRVSDKSDNWSDWKQDSFTVDKHAHPMPEFSWSPAEPVEGSEVQFTDDTIYYGGANIRNWNFGDGSTSNGNEEKPTHTYSNKGDYSISLWVEDSDGYSCPENSKPLKAKSLNFPIPLWKEIAPF